METFFIEVALTTSLIHYQIFNFGGELQLMKSLSFIAILPALFCQSVIAQPNQSEAIWQTIDVEKQLTVTDNEGEPITIEPACAFDTIPGTQIDNSFQFYFKQGKKDKLVVYFNGGGACWNDATCVTSLVKGDRPTYNPTVHAANSPIDAGGIFDDKNDDNPFKEWSKVFIPYCSGDLHLGSSDVTYHDIDGSLTGYPDTSIEVKHHGSDNFRAVKEWLKERYTNDDGKMEKLEKLSVIGSSAGGYGAIFNFSHLQELFPKTNASLLADASNSIITQSFINAEFEEGGNWNLEQTLPTFITEDFGSYTNATFNADIFSKLSAIYPESRFAQYTTAFDVVQVQFLKIMTSLDLGVLDPELWALTAADFGLFGYWNEQMNLSLESLEESTDNYQYYIGEGTVHTILTDAFATGPEHHPFYDESSAEGVLFTDWLDSFVNDKKFEADSLNYIN